MNRHILTSIQKQYQKSSNELVIFLDIQFRGYYMNCTVQNCTQDGNLLNACLRFASTRTKLERAPPQTWVIRVYARAGSMHILGTQNPLPNRFLDQRLQSKVHLYSCMSKETCFQGTDSDGCFLVTVSTCLTLW